MNKWLKRILIIAALFSVVLCGINVYFAVKCDNLFGNLFTAISGWVSFLATIGVGVFAYLQNKFYQEEAEKREKYVDLVVENVQVVNHLLPNNKLGRRSLSKNSNGNYRFSCQFFLTTNRFLIAKLQSV